MQMTIPKQGGAWDGIEGQEEAVCQYPCSGWAFRAPGPPVNWDEPWYLRLVPCGFPGHRVDVVGDLREPGHGSSGLWEWGLQREGKYARQQVQAWHMSSTVHALLLLL